ncbi:Isoleucyl-tRNA synthetase, partial [Gilliamella apicola SCGC AB-598-I20]
WQAIRTVRDVVNAAIEPLRADKSIGSSLQVDTIITVPSDLMPYVTALGDELRFVLMVAQVTVQESAELTATVSADEGQKCERCWHYTDDIGIDSQHPTICGRCATNLDGKGEQRLFA